MRIFICLLSACVINSICLSQNIGIGTTTPNASAQLDVSSTNKGFLIPRLVLGSANFSGPVVSPAEGLLVWNTNLAMNEGSGAGFYYWDGLKWRALLTDLKGWKLRGNAETDTATQFIGTTDNLPLHFRLNNKRFGKFDHIGNNIFLGELAGVNTIPGGLASHTGRSNIFLGDSAGHLNIDGYLNVCIGYQAGLNLVSGNNNVSIGAFAANDNNGSYNVSIGRNAGLWNELDENTMIGAFTGQGGTSVTGNAFLGFRAGDELATGDFNTFLGYQAGDNNVSGSTNTAVGYFSRFGSTGLSNSSVIGSRATVSASNAIVLGSVNGINGATASVNVGIGLTNPLRALHVSGSPTTTGITPHSDAVIVAEKDGDEAYISILTNDDQASALLFGNSDNVHGGIFYNTAGNSYDLRFRTNGNITRMTIDDVGQVGIGTTAPAFQLELTSNSAAKPTSSAWTIASDATLKENIHGFTDGLSVLQKINPVWFTYTGEAGLPKETGVGTLAQELQTIAPYMIRPWVRKEVGGTSRQYLGIDYGPLQFILINAVKEQQQVIESQQQQLDQYKLLFEALTKRVEELEKK